MKEIEVTVEGIEFDIVVTDIQAPIPAPNTRDPDANGFSDPGDNGHFTIQSVFTKRENRWRIVDIVDDDLMDQIYEAVEDVLEKSEWR